MNFIKEEIASFLIQKEIFIDEIRLANVCIKIIAFLKVSLRYAWSSITLLNYKVECSVNVLNNWNSLINKNSL